MNEPSPLPLSGCRIIGWDAAVDPRNNALAVGEVVFGAGDRPTRNDGNRAPTPEATADPPTVAVAEVVSPESGDDLVETVVRWIDEVPSYHPVLLCVDAPLGWPAALGGALAAHAAGEAVATTEANRLFRRATDLDIRARLGKTPLDVGADRIARTAYSVLGYIQEIRRYAAREVSLALDIDAVRTVRNSGDRTIGDLEGKPLPVWLLESYPAAWFASEGIATAGYRPRKAYGRRVELYRDVLSRIAHAEPRGWRGESIDRDREDRIVRRADTLDAVVCVYNGVDVWCGSAPGPDEIETARREGWIWCKSPV